ncbi:MAG TPA: alpha/beta hydrolase [Gammaproteobacteria bacterium]|nr:alpha/beta hydrolase [Gammaproteobacteria bacterium]
MNYIVITLLVIAGVLSAILLAIHFGFQAPRRKEKGNPADIGLTYREISIRTVEGKQLFAWWLPAASGSPTIILMHGWGGNAELMLPLAVPFQKAGMNVLLLDARNHGQSDSTSYSSLPRFAEDVSSAINWVKMQSAEQRDRIVLLGHSVGAGAVLFEASRQDDISAVISISAFAHPEWMMRRYLHRFLIPDRLTTWILRYVEWIIQHRYEDIAPMNTACKVKCPVLLVHGKIDDTVPMTDALAILKNCSEGSIELLIIDDAGHDSVDKIEHHAYQLLEFLKKSGIMSQQSVDQFAST